VFVGDLLHISYICHEFVNNIYPVIVTSFPKLLEK